MKKPLAILTITRNESFFFPIWLKHYKEQCPQAEFFVLDHESNDASVADGQGYTRLPVVQDLTDHVHWMRNVVEDMTAVLLRQFDMVLFSEVDELLVTTSRNLVTNSEMGLENFLSFHPGTSWTFQGYDVIPNGRWCRTDHYDKTLVVSEPTRWEVGFHRPLPNYRRPEPWPALFLLHLHYLDREIAWNRLQSRHKDRVCHPDKGLAFQNKYRDRVPFDAHFTQAINRPSEPIPEAFRRFLP